MVLYEYELPGGALVRRKSCVLHLLQSKNQFALQQTRTVTRSGQRRPEENSELFNRFHLSKTDLQIEFKLITFLFFELLHVNM